MLKSLSTVALAAALALSFSAVAQDKKAASGASASKSDGGAEAMFKAMDKNNDGSLSREEAKGTPHAADFDKLDKNKDGKLSRDEHAAAPEHAGKAGTGSTAGKGGKD